MIGDAPRSPLTGVPGWESFEEQDLLFSLASDIPEKGVYVEIGTEYGMSASIIRKASRPSVLMHLVDKGDKWPAFHVNMEEAGFVDMKGITIYEESSAEAVKKFAKSKRKIDLLFIDGDHSYEGALSDLNLWTGFVRQDGILALHDCACQTNPMPHALHFEVTRALTNWLKDHADEWETLGSVGSIVYLRRQ